MKLIILIRCMLERKRNNSKNRLMLLSDDGEVTRYTYDYAGNCAVKSHGPMTSVYINGVLQGVDYHDDSDYTLYVSPFMTVNADRFTKYYYAGTQRIAGKIGNGKFENIYGENGFHLTAGQKDYAQRAVTMLEGLQAYYQQTGVTPGVPNQLGKTADPYVSGTAYPNVALGNYDVPEGWPGKVVKHGKGEVPGPLVWFEEEYVQEAVAGVGYQSDNQREIDIFFYHTDHLQSTTYLTDSIGNISQFVWYAPYGEALVDEHAGSYENPYKFSGKELDENTGLYDHGARHREPSSGVWYGVDALFEKYPGVSSYSYCGGNPVRFVDMDGMKFSDALEEQVGVYEKEINDRIASIKSRKPRKWRQRKLEKLYGIQSEIETLRESSIMYDYKEYERKCAVGEKDLRGFVSYNEKYSESEGAFVVNINTYFDSNTEGSFLGAFAHEMKHAYQFEMGELSFKKNGGETRVHGLLYDLTDEYEAHERGYQFGATNRNPEKGAYNGLSNEDRYINKMNVNQFKFNPKDDFKEIFQTDIFNIKY